MDPSALAMDGSIPLRIHIPLWLWQWMDPSIRRSTHPSPIPRHHLPACAAAGLCAPWPAPTPASCRSCSQRRGRSSAPTGARTGVGGGGWGRPGAARQATAACRPPRRHCCRCLRRAAGPSRSLVIPSSLPSRPRLHAQPHPDQAPEEGKARAGLLPGLRRGRRHQHRQPEGAHEAGAPRRRGCSRHCGSTGCCRCRCRCRRRCRHSRGCGGTGSSN